MYNQVDGWSTGATLEVVGNTTVYYSQSQGGLVDEQTSALFLDLDPDAGGTYGQVILFLHDDYARSLAAKTP